MNRVCNVAHENTSVGGTPVQSAISNGGQSFSAPVNVSPTTAS